MEESKIKTLGQERAAFALEQVRSVKDKKEKEDYATYAKKLPTLIMTNGLIPTLAFLKSKSKSKDKENKEEKGNEKDKEDKKEKNNVYNSLNKWLQEKKLVKENEDSLEVLIKSDFHTLRLATIEALSFANWLKRMAEIELKSEE